MHIPEKHLETYAQQRICADIEAGKGQCDRQGYEPGGKYRKGTFYELPVPFCKI